MRRVVVLLLLLLLPAMAWGQGFVASTLENNLSAPGRVVKITGFSGALSSKAKMDQMTIADDKGVWLTLKGVTLDWSRAALLTGRVEVNELSADEIIIARPPEPGPASPPSAEAGGFSLPELPVSVNVGKILAKKVDLGAPVLGQAAVVTLSGSMKLAGGEGTAKLDIKRIDGTRGTISLAASYANSSGNLSIDLAADEAAHGLITTLIGLPGAPAVSLSVKGEGPVSDYTANIKLATDGQPRLTGAVRLKQPKQPEGATGPAPRQFSANLSGDISPLFAPDYKNFFGPDMKLAVDGTQVPGGDLTLSTMKLQARAINVSGKVTVGADGLPKLLDITGRVAARDGGPVLLPLPGVKTELGGADLTLAYDASKGDGWKGKLQIQGLNRPDFAAQTLSLSGTGTISHLSQGGAVTGDLQIAASGLKPAEAALSQALGAALNGHVQFGWQKGKPLDLPRIALNGEGYGLTASGKVEGIGAALSLDGQAEVRADDLSRFSALAGRSLGGSGQVQVKGTAALLAGSFDLTAHIAGQDLKAGQPQLDALLRGPSRIDASAKRDKTGTEIRSLTVSAQTLQAEASGVIRTGASNLKAKLDFSDLSALGAPYSGALKAQVSYAESGGEGKITADATGQDVTIGQPQADHLLRGQSTITARATRHSDGGIEIGALRVNASSLTATASGLYKAGASDLKASVDFGNLGDLGGPYSGGLKADATYNEDAAGGHISVKGTAQDIAMGRKEADALLRGKTTLDFAATRKPDGGVLIDGLSLDNPQLTAKATGQPDAQGTKLSLEARLANLALVAPGFPGPLTVSGSLSEGAGGYGVDVTAKGPGSLQADVAGTVAADMSKADVTLKGGVDAGIINGLIEPRSVRGPVRFDLRLNGPPALASVSGKVELGPARLAAPVLGISADPVTANVALSGGRANVSAQATMGGGTVTIDGPVRLAAPFDGDLAVKLSNVLFKNPDLYSTRVSGGLSVKGGLAGGATIAGALRLGRTEIQVPSTGLGGTGAVPEGLQFVDSSGAARATRARAGMTQTAASAQAAGPSVAYGLDVTISAPNQVFIRGRGLDAELGGRVKLSGTTANVVPSGGFDLLRGRLDILGKRFDLSQASLRLEGAFVPYVQISASSENDGVTSTITISGKATDPNITFSSSPALPQEEVLSHLLFGKGLTKISALQAAQLAAAVATLAGKGGTGIIGKLRSGFGLDNLDLQTGADGAAQVKAGKYLSKKVYSEVAVGSDGKSEISLNYDLTKSVTVKGTAGSDGSTGIGVFLERDY